MRTRILVQIIGYAFLLSGCGHSQQQQNAIRESAIQAKQTCDSASSDPAITPVLNKIAINVRDTTFQMRTNKSHATTTEKQALEAWIRARSQCWQAYASLRRVGQPQIVAVERDVWQETDSLVAELYSGDISYGEFNNKRTENVNEGEREIANIKQELAAQRAQIRATQSSNPVPAHGPDIAPVPSVTNCYQPPMLGIVTCQTY